MVATFLAPMAFTAKDAPIQIALRLLGDLLRIGWLALEHDHIVGFKDIVRADVLGGHSLRQ